MMMNEIGAVETLLFVAGDEGLSLEEIATVLECTTQFAFQLLTQLQKNYESSKASGLIFA